MAVDDPVSAENGVVHSKRAVGVFEGGGVRGLSYLGAYKAARERKIKFEGVAGTSVGSIAAAFAAANFSGKEIERAIRSLGEELHKFAAPPRPRTGVFPWIACRTLPKLSWAVPIPGVRKMLRNSITIATHLGLHSPDQIGKWVNEQLVECFRRRGDDKGDTIRFEHLPLPCAVIATKLAGDGVEIYTKRDTPTMPVGDAVQRSCCVPLFFQPVEAEQDDPSMVRYVDGGLLANLPLMLTAELNGCEDLPVIAFRTTATPGNETGASSKPNWLYNRLYRYLVGIVNAIVEGNVSLQRKSHSTVGTIEIDAGDVGFLDFNVAIEKQEKLVERGYETTLAGLNVAVHQAETSKAKEVLRVRRGGVVRRAAERMLRAERVIHGLLPDVNALIDLMPAIIVARRKNQNLAIRLLIAEQPDNVLDRDIPVMLGCEVQYRKGLHITGLLCDNPHERGNAWGMIIEDRDNDMRLTRLLGPADKKLLMVYWDYFDSQWDTELGSEREPVDPVLTRIDKNRVIDALRNVSQYDHDEVKITINPEFVPHNASPVKRRSEDWLVRRVDYIKQASVWLNVGFCDCVHLKGTSRVSCPPVVEIGGDGAAYVIRGHHRFLYAIDNELDTIPVVEVRGVLDDLPGEVGHRWEDIRILDESLETHEQYKNYNADLDRQIGVQLGILGQRLHEEQ